MWTRTYSTHIHLSVAINLILCALVLTRTGRRWRSPQLTDRMCHPAYPPLIPLALPGSSASVQSPQVLCMCHQGNGAGLAGKVQRRHPQRRRRALHVGAAVSVGGARGGHLPLPVARDPPGIAISHKPAEMIII